MRCETPKGEPTSVVGASSRQCCWLCRPANVAPPPPPPCVRKNERHQVICRPTESLPRRRRRSRGERTDGRRCQSNTQARFARTFRRQGPHLRLSAERERSFNSLSMTSHWPESDRSARSSRSRVQFSLFLSSACLWHCFLSLSPVSPSCSVDCLRRRRRHRRQSTQIICLATLARSSWLKSAGSAPV